MLCELSQVGTLLLVLLLGPKEDFGNLMGQTGRFEVGLDSVTLKKSTHSGWDDTKEAGVPQFYRKAQRREE